MPGYANIQVGSWGHSWAILAFLNHRVCKDMPIYRWAPGVTLVSITGNDGGIIGNDSILYRCVPGVGVSGVPGPDRKKESPGMGPLALLILFGLFNDSIDCL